MAKQPVNVSDYVRTRYGNLEHVGEYTRMQDLRGGEEPPAFRALRRTTKTGDPAVSTATMFNDLEISGKLVESGVPFPNAEPGDDMVHNKFRITVRNIPLGRQKSFDWYGSQHDYQQGKEELDRTELLEAFSSFLDDSAGAEQDFESWAGDLGYDADSRRAEKIYKAVKAESKKAATLGLEGDVLLMVAQQVRGELEGY